MQEPPELPMELPKIGTMTPEAQLSEHLLRELQIQRVLGDYDSGNIFTKMYAGFTNALNTTLTEGLKHNQKALESLAGRMSRIAMDTLKKNEERLDTIVGPEFTDTIDRVKVGQGDNEDLEYIKELLTADNKNYRQVEKMINYLNKIKVTIRGQYKQDKKGKLDDSAVEAIELFFKDVKKSPVLAPLLKDKNVNVDNFTPSLKETSDRLYDISQTLNSNYKNYQKNIIDEKTASILEELENHQTVTNKNLENLIRIAIEQLQIDQAMFKEQQVENIKTEEERRENRRLKLNELKKKIREGAKNIRDTGEGIVGKGKGMFDTLMSGLLNPQALVSGGLGGILGGLAKDILYYVVGRHCNCRKEFRYQTDCMGFEANVGIGENGCSQNLFGHYGGIAKITCW